MASTILGGCLWRADSTGGRCHGEVRIGDIGIGGSRLRLFQDPPVSHGAYVPYSHFPVAAVLELKDGTLLSGCNVENASYGLCMCAERNVLFMSVACGVPKEEIASLTVYAPTESLTTPCGACRQVMAENRDFSRNLWPFAKKVCPQL